MVAAQPRDRIQVLELIGVLKLRQEVRRSEPAEAGAAEVAVTEMPGKPPATIGLVIMPGICAAVGGVRPNDCCTASETERDHENRASFTMRDDSTRVQPPTTALVLIFWLPKAEVPVPSITPPKAPGISRSRFE